MHGLTAVINIVTCDSVYCKRQLITAAMLLNIKLSSSYL